MPQRLESVVLPVSAGGPPRELPVITLWANQQGPTVVVTANVHGDEVTGLGAIHRLVPRLVGALDCGTVHLYPTLNPDGLAGRTRKVPPEQLDLNRLFPGDVNGNPTERLAGTVWADIERRKPDVLVDLHADAPAAIPYVLLDRAVATRGGERRKLEARAQKLAEATGLTLIWEYRDDLYTSYRLDRSLSGAALNRLKIPAVTVEAGPRLYLDPAAVDVATEAVLGVLTELDMVKAPARAHPTRIGGGPWRRASGPRASSSGVFQPLVQPGDAVKRGQVVAEVRSLAGRPLERLHAGAEGHVVSLPERAWVVPGVASGTMAVKDR